MSSRHYIIPIFVPHIGCPHNCVFCNQHSITGSSEQVTCEFIIDTIEKHLLTIPKDSVKEISFFGGTFTAIPVELQESFLCIAKEYKDRGAVNYIRLSTRPDYIDDGILTRLKHYGVDIIELGIQSLDEDVLKKSGRGHSIEQVVYASKLIKDYGFTLGHQIMLGLPSDNFNKDIDTTKKIISLGPELCRIYPALVIKNTPMEDMFKRGIYVPYTLEEAVDIAKTIYLMLREANIKVIRIGLQPTEEINEGGEIVAGPFHPAFRELVESSIFNEAIRQVVTNCEESDVEVSINPRDISKVYACKKKIFNDMMKQLKTTKVIVKQSDIVERDTFVTKSGTESRTVSIYEYFQKNPKEGY